MLNCAPNKHVMYFWMFAVCRVINQLEKYNHIFVCFQLLIGNFTQIGAYACICPLCYATQLEFVRS